MPREKILKSTEVIDESAKALAATMKTDYERGLAQDIQDQVVQIYEACNFQDLAGQRIGNVIATLDHDRGAGRAHARRAATAAGRRTAGQAARPHGADQRPAGSTAIPATPASSDIDEMFG